FEISYNTLRRFFGIVKSVKPSNYTLNTLSVFNGFKSYTDFVMNFHLKNRWKEEFQMVSLMDDRKKLLEYIQTNLHSKREFVLKLTQIIRELMLIKDYNFLLRIFRLDQMNFNYFNFDDIAYFGNCTGPLLKTFDLDSADAQKLILNKNFIDTVITIFVDYKNLNNYYGECLKFVNANCERDQVSQFCKGVLNLKMYLNKERKNQMFKVKLSPDFHPILKSRVIAQELFIESNNLIEILNNYDKKAQDKVRINIDYYFEIITTAIVTKNFEVMAWILKKFEYKTKYDNFYKFEHYEHFGLLAMILFKYREDDKNLAMWFKSVSFDNFSRPYETFMLQYVYILKYHYTKKNKAFYKTKYLESAKDLYPKFFNEDYLINYFKL
ncbi:hypothetical protein N9H44_02460, partial [Saprospiraceae bacterium]|nr:hypothetical protein [Saprospiraceae bacterium]